MDHDIAASRDMLSVELGPPHQAWEVRAGFLQEEVAEQKTDGRGDGGGCRPQGSGLYIPEEGL